MTTKKAAVAAAAATAANDALAGQAAVAAQQASVARQAASVSANRSEFSSMAGLLPNRRTVAQNSRLAVLLGNAPRTQQAGPTALHALSTAVQVIEVPRGSAIYRINDQPDGFYVVVDGKVVLFDVKDRDEAEEDDGFLEVLHRLDSFGEEDMLSNSRRAHRAEVAADCPTSSALLIRVPPEQYRKYLQPLHQPDFEDKVEFLSQLEVFRSLPEETLRKLSPCFAQLELHAREYLVRQGERAESMYAIASGHCSVLVDPSYRGDQGGTAEVDPKKALKVCVIGPGNIVGDMTVLANVRRRTASILCLTDLVCYKIRRATFLRRVPAMQLETLRQVAEAKLRITEQQMSHVAGGTGRGASARGAVTLRDKLLRGHELRQLAPAPVSFVRPLELRIAPNSHHHDGVETVIARSLAAAAAAAAAAADAALAAQPADAASSSDASGGRGSGSGAAASAAFVPTPSITAATALLANIAGSVGGGGGGGGGVGGFATAAAIATAAGAAAAASAAAEARMRFGGPRKHPGLSPRSRTALQAAAAAGAFGGAPPVQDGTGGSSGGAGGAVAASSSLDRAGVKWARPVGSSSSSTPRLLARPRRVPGADKVRTSDLNFSWGLGPGTLINSLLERPNGSTVTVHRIYPNVDGPVDVTGRISEADGIGVGVGLGGVAVVPPLPLPSAAATQLRPSSRQQAHNLSFTSSRNGGGGVGGGGALRSTAAAMAASQPRWGWTSSPIDSTQSVHGPPSSFGVPAGTAFSIVGVGVNGSSGGTSPDGLGGGGGGGGGVAAAGFGTVAGPTTLAGGGFASPRLRRGGARSAQHVARSSLPLISGERLALAHEHMALVGRRSFSGGGGGGIAAAAHAALQRPGPLVIGAAAPPGIPPPLPPPPSPLMQLLHPGLARAASRCSTPMSAWTAQQSPATPPEQQQQPQQEQGAEEWKEGIPPSGLPLRSRSGAGDAAGPGGGAADTPKSPYRSAIGSPARSRYGDALLQQDQRGGGSSTVSAVASALFGAVEDEYGSDGECLTPTRREARRVKSMGKARFGRMIVTQNSSVDALVAEALVASLAQEALLQQAREAEEAMMEQGEALPVAAEAEAGSKAAGARTGADAREEEHRGGADAPAEEAAAGSAGAKGEGGAEASSRAEGQSGVAPDQLEGAGAAVEGGLGSAASGGGGGDGGEDGVCNGVGDGGGVGGESMEGAEAAGEVGGTEGDAGAGSAATEGAIGERTPEAGARSAEECGAATSVAEGSESRAGELAPAAGVEVQVGEGPWAGLGAGLGPGQQAGTEAPGPPAAADVDPAGGSAVEGEAVGDPPHPHNFAGAAAAAADGTSATRGAAAEDPANTDPAQAVVAVAAAAGLAEQAATAETAVAAMCSDARPSSATAAGVPLEATADDAASVAPPEGGLVLGPFAVARLESRNAVSGAGGVSESGLLSECSVASGDSKAPLPPPPPPPPQQQQQQQQLQPPVRGESQAAAGEAEDGHGENGHSEPATLLRPPSIGITHVADGGTTPEQLGRQPSGAFARAAAAAAAAAEDPAPPPLQGVAWAANGATSPRGPSRQPTMLQVALPESTGARSRQTSATASGQRLTQPPVISRPYPYVGPFLSVKKAPPLALNVLATGPSVTPPPGKLPSFRVRGNSAASHGSSAGPATGAAAVAAVGERLMGGGGGGGSGSQQGRRSAVEVTQSSSGGGGGALAAAGVAGYVPGGAAGGALAGVGGTGAGRGQLRRGGALYRQPTANRNGSVAL